MHGLKSKLIFSLLGTLLTGLIIEQYSAQALATEGKYSELPSLLAPQHEIRPPNISPSQQSLLDSIESGNFLAARKTIELNQRQCKSKTERLENLELLAYVDLQRNQIDSAIKQLERAEKMANASDSDLKRVRIKNFRRLGDLYLRTGKNSNAIACYGSAWALAQSVNSFDATVRDVLDSLIGCLLRSNNYNSAKPYAERLVSESLALAKDDHLVNLACLFWAKVQLLQIYKHTNPELHEKLLSEMIPLFDQLLLVHSKIEGDTLQEEESNFKKLQNGMLYYTIKQRNPSTLSDYLWLISEFRMRSLPLVNWQPHDNGAKAIILCIHGLGLENSAFSTFAKKMVEKHFIVYALDVRGFGAWQAEYGNKTVSFDKALSDIRSVISLLKSKHPGLPVFLLGESMGGAIVLRAASEFSSDISGVIASVPSAERYGETKMAVNVVLHLLRHPNKPVDISSIAEQAISKEELRELWKDDPKAKIELSPKELIKFDRFMRVTRERCSLIKTTPVMVVQGMADKLVKPEGTYDMYDNVMSPDKVMIVIGNAEHLIFENPEQPKVLLDGLAAWFENHIGAPSRQ